MYTQQTKEKIVASIAQALQSLLGSVPETMTLQYPPKLDFGDFAFPCFSLGKDHKKSPQEIAALIAERVNLNGSGVTATAQGGYVNFLIPPKTLFGSVCSEVLFYGPAYGESHIGNGERVMVEYVSPNTNKPLHLGHVRNGCLGASLANILTFAGYYVITANLVNDRGVHICKSMLAWQKWGNGETPQSTGIKGDLFVGKFYVRYAQEAEKDPSLETEIQTMLKKWEEGDPETRELWKTMNGWVYEGFAETYAKLGLKFDQFYYESDTYTLGKDLVQKGLAQGVFYRDDAGVVICDLPATTFGTEKDGSLKKAVLLRGDETSVYMTQDLGTALRKKNEHDLTRSIYVVGSEQNHHFKALFSILETLGYEWAKHCFHLSYGMVYLPDGKMKSREGKIVEADDLIKTMEGIAYEEIEKRHDKDDVVEKEMAMRATAIALGAIKFYLLSVQPAQDIHFDPASSLSFDGFTGPYCQYAYARASSILAQAGDVGELGPPAFLLLGTPEERMLVQKLMKFPEEVEGAAEQLNPARIVISLHETAKAFSQFYNKCPVLSGSDQGLKKARLALVEATAQVLENHMKLLGMKPVKQM